MGARDFMGQARLWRYSGSLLDMATAVAAFVLSYVTVYGDAVVRNVPGIQEKTLGFAVIFGLYFWILSMHRGSWRYVSIPDLTTIIKVSVATVVTYTVVAFLWTRGSNVPRSVPVLTLLYMVAGLSFSRLTYRLLMERAFFLSTSPDRSMPRKTRNVVLYGLTDNAESFIRANRRGTKSEFNVVGILDDNVLNQARIVQGVKVLGDFAALKPVVSRLDKNGTKVSELIVTEIGPTRQHLAEIVEQTARIGIKASRIPDFTATSLLTSQSILQPKAIELGDLLGRPEVVSDLEGVARLINNKVILVTGAGGSIGSELCRQIAEFGPRQLIVTDSSEFHLYMLDMEIRETHPDLNVVTRIMNVRDSARVSSLFAEFHPDSVFHAAALKHVPLVESNALEGIKTNLLGTRNVADAAMQYGASNFVMISTDKAVNPTNVMGATKRAAEAYCQSVDVSSQRTRFKTVRFGNVLGSNGSVVPRFQEQISNGGPITVTHPNIVRFFMTIPEAVRLVLNASAHDQGKREERGKIMVLDMGKPVRIVDLAERMIQLAGFRPNVDIDIVFTGLRPGEKLYEELFDPSEVQERQAEDAYFVASPRVIDKGLLHKTLSTLQEAVMREDRARAIELLNHIVPEYKPGNTGVSELVMSKSELSENDPLS
jgi:O-antigen biosynthesis protein WbqV